jgi:hypothetical protein
MDLRKKSVCADRRAAARRGLGVLERDVSPRIIRTSSEISPTQQSRCRGQQPVTQPNYFLSTLPLALRKCTFRFSSGTFVTCVYMVPLWDHFFPRPTEFPPPCMAETPHHTRTSHRVRPGNRDLPGARAPGRRCANHSLDASVRVIIRRQGKQRASTPRTIALQDFECTKTAP